MWKRRKTKDLFFTLHQQVMSSHFLGIRASVCIAVAPEDKHRNNECSSSSSFLLAFIAEQTSYGMEYPLGQFG